MKNKISWEKIMSTDLIEHRIPEFPYPEKSCIYCKKNMTLVKTLHFHEFPANYKAIYVCYNKSCPAFDEPAERAYVKVYYSNEYAAKHLDGILLHFNAPWKA